MQENKWLQLLIYIVLKTIYKRGRNEQGFSVNWKEEAARKMKKRVRFGENLKAEMIDVCIHHKSRCPSVRILLYKN